MVRFLISLSLLVSACASIEFEMSDPHDVKKEVSQGSWVTGRVSDLETAVDMDKVCPHPNNAKLSGLRVSCLLA